MDEQDEYAGQGGSYVANKETGKRERVEEPTKPHPRGGARGNDGKLVDPEARATEEAAQAEPAAPKRRSRASE